MNDTTSERYAGHRGPHQKHAFGRRKGIDEAWHIAVLVFPGFSSLDVAIIDQIFHYANRLNGMNERRYRVRLLSASGGLVRGTARMQVWSEVDRSSPLDIVFVAGGDGVEDASRDARVRGWIRETYRKGALVIGVAEGRMLIEAADVPPADLTGGLRSLFRRGNRATGNTDSAARPHDIYDPGGALFSALSIVSRDLGTPRAQEVAERVIPDSSRRLSAFPGEPSEDMRRDKMREAADWIERNCNRPITVADISQFALMSKRTLLRHFTQVIGTTPSDYLLNARFELACRLLISTALPIDKVARRCGFSSGMALAKLFRRRLSVSASEYRAAARSQQASAAHERP
jgi:AraC family transcriptional regulator, glycine betaine-responsive activator